MKTIIIRHIQSLLNTGETDEHDCDVTKKGETQAASLPMSLKAILGNDWHNKPYVGFVSPFLRTLKTAAPIHKAFVIPFFVDYRIAERPDASYMKLRRSTIETREHLFPQYRWDDFPEGGIAPEHRNIAQYEANLADFATSLPEYSVVVTHMSPVKDLVALLTGDKKTIDGIFIGNASVTVVEDGKLILHKV